MFTDFVRVYMSELGEGKFWGVEHDIVAVTGKCIHGHNNDNDNAVPAAPAASPLLFEACFDHIFFTMNLAPTDTADTDAGAGASADGSSGIGGGSGTGGSYVGLKATGPLAVRETLTPEQHALVYRDGQYLPNSWHPSDHLPLAVALEWGS
jgi:hypothetical protein